MAGFRSKFERFCYKHRNKGIPNLMLYVVLGSALFYLFTMISQNYYIYYLLCFDKASILRGQVWRLVTWILTYSPGSGVLVLLFFYFFYSLGRYVEMSLGTFKFNLFYFSGVLLMDAFAMIFCPADVTLSVYLDMGWYLHLSILLMFATTNPDSHFLLFFIIPIKAWIMGLIYLVLTLLPVLSFDTFPHNFFPLVDLLNYLIFTGSDVRNLFPFLRRRHKVQKSRPVVHFVKKTESQKKSSAPYTHRCTVCGRTDVSNPELEFRYCSRCNGYYCYCQDHISNHTHIE